MEQTDAQRACWCADGEFPANMHDQHVVQHANSPYELYAEFGIN